MAIAAILHTQKRSASYSAKGRGVYTAVYGKTYIIRRGFIMKVKICIGSACHLKGSREIIQKLQQLVAENHLESKVDLNGAFCTGNFVNGVCITVDGELYSVSPETTEEFFKKEIMGRL